nr:SRPBCC family protein [Kibdelosporangium sp. MJ126-NF4]
MGIVYSSVMDAPLRTVFDWHARPGALVRLSPPWQPVKVVQEASSLRDGTAILGLPGGLRWRARHQAGDYRPPEMFVDRLEGPLSLVLPWRHQHEFTEEGAGTRLTDQVDTLVPSFVLRPMFDYRHRQLAADLSVHKEFSSSALTVAVAGPDNAIRTAFTALLTTGGHRVIRYPTDEAVDATVYLSDNVTLVETAEGRTVRVRNGSLRAGPTWIALDDLCDIYLRALVDDQLDGMVNAVAPGNGVIQPERLLARDHRFRYRDHKQYVAHILPLRAP